MNRRKFFALTVGVAVTPALPSPARGFPWLDEPLYPRKQTDGGYTLGYQDTPHGRITWIQHPLLEER